MVNKVFIVAGVLLPLALLGEMCFHLKELNKLVQMAVDDGNRNLIAVHPPPVVEEEDTGKPLFVLHVGPGKTGTTAIQWSCFNHVELLRRDNFYFLGNHQSRKEWNLHDMFRLCYDPEKKEECGYRWEDFGKIVNEHFEQGHNVFVSEEMIAGFRNDEIEHEHLWKHLEPLLANWQVRIIFTYRRFNEWIPSKYHQAFSPTGSNVHHEKRQQWPGQGGKSTPTFSTFFDYMLDKESFTFPPAVKKRWESHFSNVRVFNMHQEGDMLENFFCKMLPEASLICKELGLEKKDSEDTKVKNSSTEKALHFDMLATRAYQKGWVHKNLTRSQVTQGVQAHAETLGLEEMTDFEVECFTRNQTEYLLLQSLEYEKDMVPDFYLSRQGKKELKAKFKEDVEKGKLCSIDVEKSLNDSRWRSFFKKLNPKSIAVFNAKIQKKKKKDRKEISNKEEVEEDKKSKEELEKDKKAKEEEEKLQQQEKEEVAEKDLAEEVAEKDEDKKSAEKLEKDKKAREEEEELQRQEKEEVAEEDLAEELAEKEAAGDTPYKVPKDFFDNY